jgi:hypothetical protein
MMGRSDTVATDEKYDSMAGMRCHPDLVKGGAGTASLMLNTIDNNLDCHNPQDFLGTSVSSQDHLRKQMCDAFRPHTSHPSAIHHVT